MLCYQNTQKAGISTRHFCPGFAVCHFLSISRNTGMQEKCELKMGNEQRSKLRQSGANLG